MHPKHYSKIWVYVGKYLTVLALATWATVQGVPELFGAGAVDKRSIVAALFGILTCSPLLGVVGYVGSRFAAISPSKDWAERIPVVGLRGLDVGKRDARIFQGFFLLAFIGIPAAGLVHFLRTVLLAPVFTRAGHVPVGHLDFQFLDLRFADRVRIGEGEGVTYFPAAEPVFLTLLCMVAWGSALHFAWRIFRPRAKGVVTPTSEGG